ncbi:MAG: hypothetical protein WAO09_10940 [Candidatus Dormiibacterota bacterium]
MAQRLSMVTTQKARSPSGGRGRHGPGAWRAAATGALVAALLISGLGTVAAKTRVPRRPVRATYLSLYVGLEQLSVVSPSLQVSTSLAAIEKHFPPPAGPSPSPTPSVIGPQLYVGLTLARFSCLPDYVAAVTYGPGARLTLSVERQKLLPGHACFQLIGPLMYQVVALPLSQFPARVKLEVAVNRPEPLLSDRSYFRLPAK